MLIGIDCRMIGSRFTGIGHYIENLIDNIAKQDKLNDYILYLNDPEYSEIKLPNSKFKKILVNSPIYSLKEQLIFPFHIYKSNPDLVHFPHFNAPILYVKKNIVTIHDVTLNTFAKSLVKKLAYNLSFFINCIKAKKIICVSNFSKQELNKQVPFTKNKSEVIYEGCIFNDKADPEHKKNAVPHIFYAGNWKAHKNVENLILAFEILKSQYKYQGQLKLTGTVSQDHLKPLELIEKSKYKKDIIQLGKINTQQLATNFQTAQVYVQPSFVEGFGLPVLEAFHYQTPVACSQTGSLPEVAGKAALYFNPHDPAEMAHQINTLLTSPKKAESLVKMGNDRLSLFSFGKMTKETIKVYQDVL